MSEVTVTIHKVGIVTCALSGKEMEGLVASFGEYKMTPLSWKVFKSLLGMRFPIKPAEPKNHQPVVNSAK